MKIAGLAGMIFIASLPSVVARAQSPGLPEKVSLCEIHVAVHDKGDNSYNNHTVSFEAAVTTTEHGAFFSDENCPTKIFLLGSMDSENGGAGDFSRLLDWAGRVWLHVPDVKPACICVGRVEIQSGKPAKIHIVSVEEIWIPRNPRTPGSQ